MNRITCSRIGLLLSLGLLAFTAREQAQSSASGSSSDSSLGDYARRARKAPGATSKPRVFDNDNLPKSKGVSIVGPPAAAPADNSTEAKPADPPAAAPAAGDTKPPADDKAPVKSAAKTSQDEEAAKQAVIKLWEGKLTAQKDEIDLLSRELDVLQREYQVRAAAMYADAGNRMRNSADWDKQDADYKQQITAKQTALDDAKQKLDDLQEEARKAGVPASARD